MWWGFAYLLIAVASAAVALLLYRAAAPGDPIVSPSEDAGIIHIYYPQGHPRDAAVNYRPRRAGDILQISSNQSSRFPIALPGLIEKIVLDGGARIREDTLRVAPSDSHVDAKSRITDSGSMQTIDIFEQAPGSGSTSNLMITARLVRDTIVTQNARTTAVLADVPSPRTCGVEFPQVGPDSDQNCTPSAAETVNTVGIKPLDPIIRIDYANKDTIGPGDPTWSLGQLSGQVPKHYSVSYVDIAEESKEATRLFYSSVFIGVSTALFSLGIERLYSAGIASRSKGRRDSGSSTVESAAADGASAPAVRSTVVDDGRSGASGVVALIAAAILVWWARRR